MHRPAVLLSVVSFALLVGCSESSDDGNAGSGSGIGGDTAGSTGGVTTSGTDGGSADTGGSTDGTTGDGGTGGEATPIPEADFAQTWAEAECAARTECGCEFYPEGEVEACIADTASRLSTLQQSFRDAGFTYNPGCAGEALELRYGIDVGCGAIEPEPPLR